jgi:pimeloyl-ACP methyl ester carboxylesterase
MNPSDVNTQGGSTIVRANGIDICYESFGKASDPPLVLIMGLAAQMIVWEDDFCELLASKGFHVIRFDNRDMGLSTRFSEAATPSMIEIMTAQFTGKKLEGPYALRDLAADTVGLLDALGFETANIVGLSMGGMIAQEIAINFPARVRTLTSIMSSTGDPSLPPATPAALGVLTRPPQTEKGPYVESYVSAWAVLNGDQLPFDAAKTTATAALGFDRGINPPGVARQMLAIIASGDRTEKLAAVNIPTLVIHGTIDPLVPPEAGHATARAIPGAKLLLVEGMGHTLPRKTWPEVADAIAHHAH